MTACERSQIFLLRTAGRRSRHAVRELILALCLGSLLFAFQAAAQPGRLISAIPLEQAKSDALAWRIRYETRDRLGQPTESTGLVVAPLSSSGDRPVVAWAPGTVGVVERCAASRVKDPLGAIPQLRAMLDRGWVVATTDYPGLGTPGPHAYLVADAAAPAVLDSVRAARQLAEARAGARFVIWGHSQGGHAGLAAAGAVARYAPELRLAGVVAVSPPTDLAANMSAVSRLARGLFAALVARSWSATYGIPLSTIANGTTQGVIRRATASCVDDRTGLPQLVRGVRLRVRLGNIDFARRQPWSELIVRNSIAGVPSSVPALVVSASKDPVVADSVTRRFVVDACARGGRIAFLGVPGRDHATVHVQSGQQAVAWIADRFADRPPTGICPPGLGIGAASHP